MFKKQEGIEYIDLESKSGQQRKFVKVKHLGSGGFARCYEVFEQVNQVKNHYAFKIIRKSTLMQSKQLVQRLRTQIRLQKKFSENQQIQSQHIVRFIQSFQTTEYIYMLLQLCVNQTLNQLIRRRKYLSEQQTRFFIWQLAKGLKEIHLRNVVHRDIKLCNLFLTNGLRLKIGDFGLANQIQQGRKRSTVCGTANYIAPQMLKNNQKKTSIGHSYQVDTWGLGVVCYTIFYGRYPFQSQQQKSIYDKILSGKFSFNPYSLKEMKQLNINSTNHFASDQLKRFLKSIFQVDPQKRLTLDQVLTHQFIIRTKIPQHLPQIALKCAFKRQTIEKLFQKMQSKNNEIQNEVFNMKIDQIKQIGQDLNVKQEQEVGQQSYGKQIFSNQCKNSELKSQKTYALTKSQNAGSQSVKCQLDRQLHTNIKLPHEERAADLEQIQLKVKINWKRQFNLSLQKMQNNSNGKASYVSRDINQKINRQPKQSQLSSAQLLILQIIFQTQKNQTNALQDKVYESYLKSGLIVKVGTFLRGNKGKTIKEMDEMQHVYSLIIHHKLKYIVEVINSQSAIKYSGHYLKSRDIELINTINQGKKQEKCVILNIKIEGHIDFGINPLQQISEHDFIKCQGSFSQQDSKTVKQQNNNHTFQQNNSQGQNSVKIPLKQTPSTKSTGQIQQLSIIKLIESHSSFYQNPEQQLYHDTQSLQKQGLIGLQEQVQSNFMRLKQINLNQFKQNAQSRWADLTAQC